VSETIWNAWKMTTFGLLLVGATALVTTLVMSYRADREDVRQTGAASARKASVPRQLEVAACQAYAQQGTEEKMKAVSKDVASSSAGGAGVGDAGGAAADGDIGAGKGAAGHDAQYQAAYRSCMRQRGY
jgi:hypothetical protein